MSRFQVGDAIRLWKPHRFEHGLKAVVGEVITIEAYYGDPTPLEPWHRMRGPHAYKPVEPWRDEGGVWFYGGFLPDAMVASEAQYQAWLREHGSPLTRP